MKKKFLSLVICFVSLISLLPQTVVFASTTIVASGECGIDLTWTLDGEGTLTISGEGEMFFAQAPWYSSRESIKKVVIGHGVTSIVNNAFLEYASLENIIISDSVMRIGESAFSGCTSLANITIPDSVTYIGNSAFYNTAYYNTADNWENGVLYIGNRLIKVDKDVSGDVQIKNSVTSIESYAFSGCTRLSGIVIPDNVIIIGGYAFLGCTSLSSITIPNSVISIGADAFKNTEYYDNSNNWINGILYIDNCLISAKRTISGEVKIKDGITCIACYAFTNCKSLTSITIPDSVKSIGTGAFYFCRGLVSVSLPAGIENIEDHTFTYCDSLTGITIPKSVMRIGGSVFYYCSGLTSIEIPDGVTVIETQAFDGCSNLRNITIPNSVTSIENMAFNGCTNLSEVYYTGTADDWKKIEIGTYNEDVKNIEIYCIYTLSYDANGGLNAPATQTEMQGTNLEISSDIPIRKGCIFEGWSTSANGEIEYSPGDTYYRSVDITLYAVWKRAVSYSFGQSVQIGLIEPWFLKANARVYTDENPINIDYNSLIDYGVYFIRASELSDESATQISLSAEDIINDSDAVKHSKAERTATIDGNYITANYDKGLYTYELDDSVFVLFYIEDEGGIVYAPIRERNLKSLLEARKDDVVNFPNELERNVYKSMLDMFGAINAYRDDYYKNN